MIQEPPLMFRMPALAVPLAMSFPHTTPAVSIDASSPLVSTPSARAASFNALNDGVFGCLITFNAKNDGNSPVTIRLGESSAKVRLGLWNRIDETIWVVSADGKAKTRQVNLAMPCTAGDRQYKLLMSKLGGEREVFYPSNDEFTGERTIPLGNVARHF
jgi:hypothetical protein